MSDPAELFGNIERQRLDSPRSGETKFSYLDSSARPEAIAVREFLQYCLGRYPDKHRARLAASLKSIDANHDAAVFELIVHELLIRNGCQILDVEPELAERSTSPDFLVRSPNNIDFVVECVVATGKSDAEVGAERRIAAAIDTISKINSPDHYLAVKTSGTPSAPITGKRLRRELSSWIEKLPKGELARKFPPFIFDEHGLRLFISPMLAKDARSGRTSITIGSTSSGLYSAIPGEDLRRPLLKKATKYGNLEKPFIIAVNAVGISSGDRDLLAALLGSPVAVLRGSGAGEARMDRAEDGLWHDGRQPRKRGVSAVLGFDRADAWRPWGRAARLIHNPYATHPLPEIELAVRQLKPVNGTFLVTEDRFGPATFGLHKEWPE